MIERKLYDLVTVIPEESAYKVLRLIYKEPNLGRHELENGIYINIENYITKPLSEGKYETHNNYTDIQFTISGRESIFIKNKSQLSKSNGYNKDNDIEFYGDDIDTENQVTLDGTNFVVIYPSEAHAPQIAEFDEPMPVKKAVIKIPV